MCLACLQPKSYPSQSGRTELSDVLGAEWTLKDININALYLYPYAVDGYAKEESLGSCIEQANPVSNTASDTSPRQSTTSNPSPPPTAKNGKSELNSICHARSLLIDLDDRPEDARVSYCGVPVKEGGVLALVFSEGNLGTNLNYAIETQGLLAALHAAPGSVAAMSFAARTSVRQDYDDKIEETRKKVGGYAREA
ncbi:hypothetical protein CSAL01_05328 [Colletotrichum salicis]|uniref:Uncharacterized protein n=1 Tax=Colletotrichum salicis TaxID=1209931 RepID=A0A135U534_9PEZI|nr:hypothetical protein CSAL01_05328 [Colletotrichum salicis]